MGRTPYGYVIMDMKISLSGQTIVRPTAVPRSHALRLSCLFDAVCPAAEFWHRTG